MSTDIVAMGLKAGSLSVKFAVVVGVAIYLYYTILLIQQNILLRGFKGPLALPIIGNLYSPGALTILKFLSGLKKKYGRVFTFFMFSRPYLVICDPVAVRRILCDPLAFPKGDDYKIFGIPFGTGLVTSVGDKHRKDKMLFGKYFAKSNLSQYVPLMNETVEDYMKTLPTSETEACNIEKFFATLAMRTFSKFSMNWTFKTQEREKEMCGLISKGSLAVGETIIFSWLPPFLLHMLPNVKYMKAVRKSLWDDDVKPLVEERRKVIANATADHPAPDDLLTAMIKENMTEDLMLDHVVTLLSAGHDTTAYFSSYFVYMMSKHPEVQQKLYLSIKEVVDKKHAAKCAELVEQRNAKSSPAMLKEIEEEVKKDASISEADINKMFYLTMTMQEVLRNYAIIPQVTRVAAEDVTIKELNLTIPKGVNIFIPMFLINRDEELWENPADFNPDRFKIESENGMWNFTSAKNGFFPFGYGSRVCIGNSLAQMESAIFLCRLMLKYEILPDEKFRPNIMSGISLTTSNGLNVKLRLRK